MQQKERKEESSIGATLLKGVLIGAGIGIAAIGSALLGYGVRCFILNKANNVMLINNKLDSSLSSYSSFLNLAQIRVRFTSNYHDSRKILSTFVPKITK